MERSLTFVIVGEERMHCGGCESRVANALGRLDGVREVAASARDQRVVVRGDASRLDAGGIVARLAQLGYQATLEEPDGGHGTIAEAGAR